LPIGVNAPKPVTTTRFNSILVLIRNEKKFNIQSTKLNIELSNCVKKII
jgi:hypothetical protein